MGVNSPALLDGSRVSVQGFGGISCAGVLKKPRGGKQEANTADQG